MKIETVSNIVACPYCGHKNTIKYSVEDYRTDDVIYCDVKNGGCDQPFVVRNSFKVGFTSQILEVKPFKPKQP